LRPADAHTNTIACISLPQDNFASVLGFGIHCKNDPGIEVPGLYPGDLNWHTQQVNLPDLHNRSTKRPLTQDRVKLQGLGSRRSHFRKLSKPARLLVNFDRLAYGLHILVTDLDPGHNRLRYPGGSKPDQNG
jgi:hypothetical protein